MKAVGYIRVSTADQANSLEVQTKKIKDYAKFKGLTLTEIFVDEDVSGGKPFDARQGGAKANRELKKSDVNIIIAVKPDRLFRSVKDALIVVDEWAEKNIALHIIDLGGNSVDSQTALGRMFFIQAISMGEFERRITAERTSAVLNHKKNNKQIYCGGVFGYDNVDGKMVINESEMAIVKSIKQKHTNKVSLGAIAAQLNLKGIATKKGGSWHSSTIKNIISNPIYGL